MAQNKGNAALAAAFVNAVPHDAASLVLFEEYVEVTQATLAAVDSLRVESAAVPTAQRHLARVWLNGPEG